MLSMKTIPVVLLVGLFVTTACSSANGSSVTPATTAATPLPAATEVKLLPTWNCEP